MRGRLALSNWLVDSETKPRMTINDILQSFTVVQLEVTVFLLQTPIYSKKRLCCCD